MSWQALEVFSFYCTNQLVVKELQLYFDFENLLIFFFFHEVVHSNTVLPSKKRS